MDSKTLFVVIKKKYFDLILTGTKKNEYRNVTDFWMSRLIEPGSPSEDVKFRKYNQVLFQCGYRKDARRMLVQLKGITIDFVPEFNLHENIFVIQLGKIIERPKAIPFKLHAV